MKKQCIPLGKSPNQFFRVRLLCSECKSSRRLCDSQPRVREVLHVNLSLRTKKNLLVVWNILPYAEFVNINVWLGLYALQKLVSKFQPLIHNSCILIHFFLCELPFQSKHFKNTSSVSRYEQISDKYFSPSFKRRFSSIKISSSDLICANLTFDSSVNRSKSTLFSSIMRWSSRSPWVGPRGLSGASCCCLTGIGGGTTVFCGGPRAGYVFGVWCPEPSCMCICGGP